MSQVASRSGPRRLVLKILEAPRGTPEPRFRLKLDCGHEEARVTVRVRFCSLVPCGACGRRWKK